MGQHSGQQQHWEDATYCQGGLAGQGQLVGGQLTGDWGVADRCQQQAGRADGGGIGNI